jgi:cytochrome P450
VSYLRQAIALRRREPRDDLISKLCAENSALGEGLTEQELTSVCVFLVVAGMEAVENVIGNGMFALLAHPEEMRYLSANLDIIPSAVEELLRFETPLQLVMRLALEDVEIGGRHIPAGDYVYLVLGSANRDPERFDRPDDLLFDRAQNHHLSFGDGHHLCVGAQLARVQGQEALRALLEMMPQMTLATDELNWGSNLNWGRSLLSRGLLSLPVRFAGAR